MDTQKIAEARKTLDAEKMYMNPATGSVDTGEGWIQDCVDRDNGFPINELGTLHEVRKTVTDAERREWGEWMPPED